MLELENLSVSFGSFIALSSINMEVQEGELLVLLGANGSGKTTLLKTLSGLSKPSGGLIKLQGKKISGLRPSQIVKQGISQCAEGRRLFNSMSVYKNLLLGAYTCRKDKKGVQNSLDYVYSLFPILKEKENDPAGSLSGGQQQNVAIGRALKARPKVLLLDEPSMGLAPMIVQQMFNIIEAINSEGTTILLAEQNAYSALKIAHRAYVIENGAVVMSGSSEDIAKNERVRQIYIGA
ncbi:MAG: ABC transporter ATP-binding protein [Desulfocucumaceae bacterium]